MIKLLTGIKTFQTDDESDALAAAICHLMQHPFTKNKNQLNIDQQKLLSKGPRSNSSLSAALIHRATRR